MNELKRWFGKRPSAPASRCFHSTRLQLESLEDRRVPTVSFFGGNLLPHVQAQALFLGSEFLAAAAASTEPAILNPFLKDLTGGPYLQALQNAGYNVGTGSAVAGAVDLASLTAGSTISDAFIRARLQADISNGHLQSPNANTLYVVYVEPNVAVNLGGGKGTTQQGILGYHTAFVAANGAAVRYAVVVAPGGLAHNSVLPEANTALDQLTAVTSHEVAEAVTDPDINSNVNNGRLGWIDPQRGEIADIEANNPSAYVRLPDGHLVQEVANRNDQLLSIFTPPSPLPPSPLSALIGATATLQGSVNPTSPLGGSTVPFPVIDTPSSGTPEPGAP